MTGKPDLASQRPLTAPCDLIQAFSPDDIVRGMAPAAAKEILELDLERPTPLYLTNIVAGGGGARCSTLNDFTSQGVARGRPASGVASRVRVPSSLLR